MKIIVSEDQNTVIVDGVKTTFKKMEMKKNICTKCWWGRLENCSMFPCIPSKRKDGENGVFTIQNMPSKSNSPWAISKDDVLKLPDRWDHNTDAY